MHTRQGPFNLPFPGARLPSFLGGKMQLRIELSGGLELLFGSKKTHDVVLPADGTWTAERLIQWARDNLLTERPELFVKGNTVRPGILVLINDCDWELSGTLGSELHEGDTVTFISTLHGG